MGQTAELCKPAALSQLVCIASDGWEHCTSASLTVTQDPGRSWIYPAYCSHPASPVSQLPNPGTQQRYPRLGPIGHVERGCLRLQSIYTPHNGLCPILRLSHIQVNRAELQYQKQPMGRRGAVCGIKSRSSFHCQAIPLNLLSR